MRKLVFGAAVATIMMSGHAEAADMGYPQYAAPPPPPLAYRWMGPYFGANVGYQWGSIDNNPAKPSGVAGGIQAGYNWQNGNFVLGAEADIRVIERNRSIQGCRSKNSKLCWNSGMA